MDKELESSFTLTTKILLGKPLSGLEAYSAWLGQSVPLPYPAKSALSDKEVWVAPEQYFLGKRFNPARIISMDEIGKIEPQKVKAPELEGMDVTALVKKVVMPHAYYCGNFRYKTYMDVARASGTGDASHVDMVEDTYHNTKNVAYANCVLYENQCVFGGHTLTYAQFCIHAYNCNSVVRCFELEGCNSCSDSYFCHNCEGLAECMFCFNSKSLRYAIGNVEVGKEKYMEIKKKVLEGIANELEKNKKLERSIFNIGRHAKRVQ
ncbi:Uncharacterised protein [uncultured archaeon]|nr:Uncharacterised protein [uncultured archaeon]